MARGQVVGDDPYRVLQVDPAACPEVIAAAFSVLREMVLASDDDDAPRRLARLNAAHRTLADPLRRAAHDAGGHHLARVEVARPRAPVDPPLLRDVVQALAPGDVADASPGFVWRMRTEREDLTAMRILPDDTLLIAMSVWESVDALRAFTDGAGHAAVHQRGEWLARLGEPETALWWVPAGVLPTVEDAGERLTALRRDGPTPRAFTLREAFPPGC